MNHSILNQFARPIKNIIFDLGGVLLDIDYSAAAQAFTSLGVVNFAAAFSQAKQAALFDAFDTGAISAAEFRAELRKLASRELTDEQLDGAWNAMLGGYRLSSLRMVEALRGCCRVFLLSNTNEIHYPHIDGLLSRSCGRAALSEFFERAYYSHLIRARKPDAAAFLHVLQENGLLAAETLFVDDTLGHVEGAKKVGLNGLHLTPPNTVAALFS